MRSADSPESAAQQLTRSLPHTLTPTLAPTLDPTPTLTRILTLTLALTSAAFSAGSLDNCTAVVVALQGYKAGVGFTPADFIPSPGEPPLLSPPTSFGLKPTPAFDFIPSPREPPLLLPLLSPLEPPLLSLLERLGDERGIGWRDGMRRFMGAALLHPVAPTGLAPCNGR